MKSKGFGLIEVLIAMAIIAIGFLGIAALNSSIKLTSAAQNRLIASTIAADLASRMEVNFVDARKAANSVYNDPNSNKGVKRNCTVSGITCNTTRLAQDDLYLVGQRASLELPSGKIKVCYTDTANANCVEGTTTGVNLTAPGGCIDYISSFTYATFSIVVTWLGRNNVTETFIRSVRP